MKDINMTERIMTCHFASCGVGKRVCVITQLPDVVLGICFHLVGCLVT